MRLFRRSLLCLVVGVTAFGAAGCGGPARPKSIYDEIVLARGEIFVCKSSDDLQKLRTEKPRAIGFYDLWIAPTDLGILSECQTLEVIAAENRSTSKEAIERYAKAPGLRALKLWQTTFSIEKLTPLHNCPTLSEVILSGPGLTDEVLKDLAKISHLRHIQVSENQFSDQAVSAVAKERPDLYVQFLVR